MRPNLTVVTLADEDYAKPLAVLGRSLVDNLSPALSVCFYVIDGGIAEETKKRLFASWDLNRLRVEFVAPQLGGERVVPVWGRMPALTYARIFVEAHVPAPCEKAIFLDSDIVVTANLENLWRVPIEGCHVLAVQDPAIPFVSSRDGLTSYPELGIGPRAPYFNAGVMVIDLVKWRADNISTRVMSFVRKHERNLNYCDQDGLNAVLFDKWRPLDPRWHVQPRFTVSRHLPLPHLSREDRASLTADPGSSISAAGSNLGCIATRPGSMSCSTSIWIKRRGVAGGLNAPSAGWPTRYTLLMRVIGATRSSSGQMPCAGISIGTTLPCREPCSPERAIPIPRLLRGRQSSCVTDSSSNPSARCDGGALDRR